MTSSGSKAVWAVDGNLDYLRGRHIPLFVVGVGALSPIHPPSLPRTVAAKV